MGCAKGGGTAAGGGVSAPPSPRRAARRAARRDALLLAAAAGGSGTGTGAAAAGIGTGAGTGAAAAAGGAGTGTAASNDGAAAAAGGGGTAAGGPLLAFGALPFAFLPFLPPFFASIVMTAGVDATMPPRPSVGGAMYAHAASCSDSTSVREPRILLRVALNGDSRSPTKKFPPCASSLVHAPRCPKEPGSRGAERRAQLIGRSGRRRARHLL